MSVLGQMLVMYQFANEHRDDARRWVMRDDVAQNTVSLPIKILAVWRAYPQSSGGITRRAQVISALSACCLLEFARAPHCIDTGIRKPGRKAVLIMLFKQWLLRS
jgi:hypothetical protein